MDSFCDSAYEITVSNFEIRKIFDIHKEMLFNQMMKMTDDIFNWGEFLLNQIQEHMANQKRLLNEEYARQRDNLEKQQQEYIDKAVVFKMNREDEQIQQLIAQCTTLKFELTALEYSMRPTPYISLTTRGNLASENSQRESKDDHEKVTEIKVSIIKSSPSKVTSADIQQKNPRSLIATPINDENQSRISHNDLTQECPICYMVFPSYMTPNSRNDHANVHFLDSDQIL